MSCDRCSLQFYGFTIQKVNLVVRINFNYVKTIWKQSVQELRCRLSVTLGDGQSHNKHTQQGHYPTTIPFVVFNCAWNPKIGPVLPTLDTYMSGPKKRTATKNNSHINLHAC